MIDRIDLTEKDIDMIDGQCILVIKAPDGSLTDLDLLKQQILDDHKENPEIKKIVSVVISQLAQSVSESYEKDQKLEKIEKELNSNIYACNEILKDGDNITEEQKQITQKYEQMLNVFLKFKEILNPTPKIDPALEVKFNIKKKFHS